MTERPYEDHTKPGRLDINGVEWWACDPYPTWYRYVGEWGFDLRLIPAAWEDEREPAVYQHDVFIQWKGTDICCDLHCDCGQSSHFDGGFAYVLKCPHCEKLWEMPHTVIPTSLARTDIEPLEAGSDPAKRWRRPARGNRLPQGARECDHDDGEAGSGTQPPARTGYVMPALQHERGERPVFRPIAHRTEGEQKAYFDGIRAAIRMMEGYSRDQAIEILEAVISLTECPVD
jgi:hypothetical protein